MSSQLKPTRDELAISLLVDLAERNLEVAKEMLGTEDTALVRVHIRNFVRQLAQLEDLGYGRDLN
ncbi:MAG: hypothetical protein JWR69_919, partial [Pedosphaera sp.]|nr:hypothetical protein [Pedosphaera sp.]